MHQRARAVDEVARHHVVAGHEAAVGAERQAERAGDHVDLALEPGLGDRAAAARAERADRVRLVDEQAHVVAPRELDDLLERGDVAVEPEEALGGDQRAAAVGLPQPPREVLGVAVVVGERVRAGEPAAVDDRGVVELVGKTTSPRRASAGITPRLASEPEPNSSAARAPLKPRGAPRAGGAASSCPRRPRRAGADAPAHRGVGRGLAHARVVGEPERVARAEQEHGRPSSTTRGPCGPLTMRRRR